MKMSFGDVLLETALVFYVNLTSIIGIYTLPEFNKIFQKSVCFFNYWIFFFPTKN